MKYFHISILLLTIMVLGSFSGIYATAQNNHNGVGKTFYVSKNGNDRNDGLTPTNPKKNIETAINAADPGDTIKVSSGVYSINLKINKNITLIGAGQDTTIIDGHQAQICIKIAANTNASIIGFTIKNGKQGKYESGRYNLDYGGGIQNKGILNLKNSTITDNIAALGGGICNDGILTISGVTVKNNKADDSWGGGIYSEDSGKLTMEDSIIMDNSAKMGGGGIYSRSEMFLSHVTAKNNKADYGGGLAISGDTATVEDSLIIDNTAGTTGGGISTGCPFLYLYGTTITNNKAANGGGISNRVGIYADEFTLNHLIGNIPNNHNGAPLIPA